MTTTAMRAYWTCRRFPSRASRALWAMLASSFSFRWRRSVRFMRTISIVPDVSEECKDGIYCNLKHLCGCLSARQPDDGEQRASASAGPVGANPRAGRIARQFFASFCVYRLRRAVRRHHSEPLGRWTVRTVPGVLLPASRLLLVLWRLWQLLRRRVVVGRRAVRLEGSVGGGPQCLEKLRCQSSIGARRVRWRICQRHPRGRSADRRTQVTPLPKIFPSQRARPGTVRGRPGCTPRLLDRCEQEDCRLKAQTLVCFRDETSRRSEQSLEPFVSSRFVVRHLIHRLAEPRKLVVHPPSRPALIAKRPVVGDRVPWVVRQASRERDLRRRIEHLFRQAKCGHRHSR